jgi:hypothetical protein
LEGAWSSDYSRPTLEPVRHVNFMVAARFDFAGRYPFQQIKFALLVDQGF